MRRRFVRVLEVAWPFAGLLLLFFVGKAIYEDQRDQSEVFVISTDEDEQAVPPRPASATHVAVRLVPPVELERLPPIESELEEVLGVGDANDEFELTVATGEPQPSAPELSQVLPVEASPEVAFTEEGLVDDRLNDSVVPEINALADAHAPEQAPIELTPAPIPVELPVASRGTETAVNIAESNSEPSWESGDWSEIEATLPNETYAADVPWVAPEQDEGVSEPSETTLETLDEVVEVEDENTETTLEPEFAWERGGPSESVDLVGNTPVTQTTVLPLEAVELQDDPAPTLAEHPPATSVPTSPTWAPVDIRDINIDAQQLATPTRELPQATDEGRREADNAVALGFQLVQRGAPFSARARFIEALRVMARSLDDRNETSIHSVALRRALSAYQEAADFYPKATRPDQDVNLEHVIGGHETRLLQDAVVRDMSPSRCVREYVAYAEQEFTKAVGSEEIASKALYGLGRLEWATSTTTSSSTRVRAYRAIALYQAAMSVHPGNYAAANELAVLLARLGRDGAAIAALQHSLEHSAQPTVWRNLANLYRRAGHLEQARHADQEAVRAASRPVESPYALARPQVEWVEPEEFSRVTGQADMHIAKLPVESMQVPQKTPVAKQTTQNRRWPFGGKALFR